MIPAGVEAQFIDGSRGRLFVMLRRPPALASGPCVLIVPPFAEEMNKSRSILAELSRRLALNGIGSVLPDVYGTGDSSGEFCDGDWELWQDDLVRVASMARSSGLTITSMLGIRLGCALGAAAAARFPVPLTRTVFWQPVIDGERYLNQFLRLRVAASMMEDRQETVAGLRARFGAGEMLEIAGYEVSPALLRQIDGINLISLLHEGIGDLQWFEVVRSEEAAMPQSAAAAIKAAEAVVGAITARTVVGEPFWSSTEIVSIPGLVAASVSALGGRE